jgi:hypothetical protein
LLCQLRAKPPPPLRQYILFSHTWPSKVGACAHPPPPKLRCLQDACARVVRRSANVSGSPLHATTTGHGTTAGTWCGAATEKSRLRAQPFKTCLHCSCANHAQHTNDASLAWLCMVLPLFSHHFCRPGCSFLALHHTAAMCNTTHASGTDNSHDAAQQALYPCKQHGVVPCEQCKISVMSSVWNISPPAIKKM